MVENTNYIHKILSLVENEIYDAKKLFFGIIVKFKKKIDGE